MNIPLQGTVQPTVVCSLNRRHVTLLVAETKSINLSRPTFLKGKQLFHLQEITLSTCLKETKPLPVYNFDLKRMCFQKAVSLKTTYDLISKQKVKKIPNQLNNFTRTIFFLGLMLLAC